MPGWAPVITWSVQLEHDTNEVSRGVITAQSIGGEEDTGGEEGIGGEEERDGGGARGGDAGAARAGGGRAGGGRRARAPRPAVPRPAAARLVSPSAVREEHFIVCSESNGFIPGDARRLLVRHSILYVNKKAVD